MSGRRAEPGLGGESGPDRPPLGEFDFIAQVLRPLTADTPEALNLADDAALLPARPGYDLVVTQDAIVEGVHFLPGDPPDLVAKKLLRVNLSDLAAKAATPYGYLLTTAWPAAWGRAARERFVRGLAADQTAYGLSLFGGDTVSTPGPATFSATMLGWVAQGRMVKRSGGKPGDQIVVTGSVGDAWLGLGVSTGRLPDLPAGHRKFVRERYALPTPRTQLAKALGQFASAAADVSDGLLADVTRLTEASEVGANLDLDMTPLSQAAAAWLAGRSDPTEARLALAAGGDDYEVIATVPTDAVADLMRAGDAAGVRITRIGALREAAGVDVYSAGRKLEVAKRGWAHA